MTINRSSFKRLMIGYFGVSCVIFLLAFTLGFMVTHASVTYCPHPDKLMISTTAQKSEFLRIVKINCRSYLMEALSVFSLGAWTILLLVQNGSQLGALTSRVGWSVAYHTVALHGVPEMLAILVNASATLSMIHCLGQAVHLGAFPNRSIYPVYVGSLIVGLLVLIAAAFIESTVTPFSVQYWLTTHGATC